MKKCGVLSLRPTQFAIGMEEVKAKLRKLERLGGKQLAKYVKKHPVKVLRAPGEQLYVIDHHHELAAVWLVGIKKVPVDVQKNVSRRKVSPTAFWRFMSTHGLVHLYDQFGDGPRDPLYLPEDIRGVGDDPYRSLAWLAKEQKAFDDSDIPYYDFEWAQLLRRHRLLDPNDRSSMRRALGKAIDICRSPVARKLPGYRGNGSRRRASGR
jgi:hypothetical protein